MISRILFAILLALTPVSLLAQTKAIVKGKISDASGKPIEFANVFVRSQNTGTVTDEDGFYALDLSPGEDILLEVSHASYEKRSRNITVSAGFILTANFQLKQHELDGVEIRDTRMRRTTMTPVPIKDIKVNPSVQQGIESVLASQIGVSMNNELSSNYSVRGGSFAENLVYVNDIEVYRPFLARAGEQEGLSFPNPDMVGSIYFSAGGFDARYGDRMSSVLDIHYKKPAYFGGSFSASLLGGSASLESASKNRKFSQVTGVRYMTNQYLLGSLDNQGDYQPNFTDIQTYWTYDIAEKWKVSFLGNYSRNQYKFVPETRNTDFGTINEALSFTVFFEGQEITSFETLFGAVSTEFLPDKDTRLKFTVSAFQTYENETFDVLGRYSLDELDRDLGSDNFGNIVRNRGAGGYLRHARNELNATVFNVAHRGFKSIDNKYLQWGLTWRGETIEDKLSEWTMIDSAGYSIPIAPSDQILLQDVIKGRNTLDSYRLMGYLQNSWDWLLDNEDQLSATVGVRVNYWSYNRETVASPRGTLAWKPKWVKQINDSTTLIRNVVFRFSTGVYYQPAFYRELRGIDGTLNPEIRAQRSIHFVLGSDLEFRIWNRPFKLVTEAYYKALSDLVPYEIDNVRLRYYGTNESNGYATGLDIKINGEFIPGIQSWASISFMRTMEDLENDFFYNYFDTEGQPMPETAPASLRADSSIVYPGYIPRPTDQLVYFSMFFQDEMPSFPSFKVHINALFGTGLPFGPPDFVRHKDTERYRAYRRVDIGFSKDLTPKVPGKGLFGNFKRALLSLEVWNILDFNNTINYTWVKDSSGLQYGVPNYLTPRRVNVKLVLSF